MRNDGLFTRARVGVARSGPQVTGALRGLLRHAWAIGLPTAVLLLVTFAFYSAPSVAVAAPAAKPPTASDKGAHPGRSHPPPILTGPPWAPLTPRQGH